MDDLSDGNSNEKTPFEIFSYISSIPIQHTWRLYDSIDTRRGNILTVLSFCLIGEITFLAIFLENLKGSLLPTILLALMFALWLIAFIVAMYTRKLGGLALHFPGTEEGLSFLPNDNEIKKFFDDKQTEHYDADIFFAKEFINRRLINHDATEGLNSSQIISKYYEKLPSTDSLKDFNCTAWVASTNAMMLSAVKANARLTKLFKCIYTLLATNLFILVVLIIMAALQSNDISVNTVCIRVLNTD